ncbi:alpha/beta fold hydrolase [Pseudomonas veronii]|uniref:alpha/beta fold hydrolase n=1 Tax=Pseudomonas veronii TaxID=76761 RepID=UPI00143DCC9A|nr:alpha/beta hydrolase [Pseudomonas veronii]
MSTFQEQLSVGPGMDAVCRAFAVPDRVPASPREMEFLARAKRSTLEVDAQHIVYWTFGKGPRVLLVHGWCSRGSHLMSFVEPILAAGFSVALFDAPGHGDSEGIVSSMIHAGRTALALAEKLGDVHSLISHSGGSTAALWALSNGLSVEKSVHLCGPSSMKEVVLGIARAHGLDRKEVLVFKNWAEAFARVSLDSADLPALTSGLLHPGLIVHDAGDRIVDISQSQALHAAWFNSTLVVTEGLGHRRILGDLQVITAIVDFIEI